MGGVSPQKSFPPKGLIFIGFMTICVGIKIGGLLLGK